ncbi:MAG: C69 family dipeptidase [Gammaproteobacteria bacterium]|nr:C69 family dipeptidase [Gammaproteobacteria bacterium]
MVTPELELNGFLGYDDLEEEVGIELGGVYNFTRTSVRPPATATPTNFQTYDVGLRYTFSSPPLARPVRRAGLCLPPSPRPPLWQQLRHRCRFLRSPVGSARPCSRQQGGADAFQFRTGFVFASRCAVMAAIRGRMRITSRSHDLRFPALATLRRCWAWCCSSGSAQGMASLAVYVGKDLTRDGSVLLAGFGDEPSSHWLSIVPRQQHPEGATIRVGADGPAGWGNSLPGELIEIPQARETFRYLSMDYSEFAGFPAPLTNGGMNEHGLGVRDVALFSRDELVAMTPDPQRGPQYSDLARIALERARTAREAVEISVELIERHGFTTYGGNSHVFADPEEGWVLLEFAGGQGLWVARRLGSDEIWMNWRGYHRDRLRPDPARRLARRPGLPGAGPLRLLRRRPGLAPSGGTGRVVRRDRGLCPGRSVQRPDRARGPSRAQCTAGHGAGDRRRGPDDSPPCRRQGLLRVRPGGPPACRSDRRPAGPCGSRRARRSPPPSFPGASGWRPSRPNTSATAT